MPNKLIISMTLLAPIHHVLDVRHTMNYDDLTMEQWLRLPEAAQWRAMLAYLPEYQRDRSIYGYCRRGHRQTPENSQVRRNGARRCRICEREARKK